MITKEYIINKYLGLPYVHEGRTMEGLDCFGIAVLIYRELGHELFDFVNLPPDWSLNGCNHMIENYWRDWERVDTPKFLDGVMLKNYKGIANHGGLMLDDHTFIHCVKKIGVVIGDLNQPSWKKRFENFYRLKARIDED